MPPINKYGEGMIYDILDKPIRNLSKWRKFYILRKPPINATSHKFTSIENTVKSRLPFLLAVDRLKN